jgi:hypothetical protein
VFKACDNLEMWEYGVREVNRGNNYAKIIVTRMMTAVALNISALTAMEDHQQYKTNEDVVPSIHKYMQKRLKMEDF